MCIRDSYGTDNNYCSYSVFQVYVNMEVEVGCSWLGHVLIEGRMKGKACRRRRRLHMLSDVASSTKYLKGKRTEDREG